MYDQLICLSNAVYYWLGTNYLTMILGPATLSVAAYLVRIVALLTKVNSVGQVKCFLEATSLQHVQLYPEC
jgi:hypothetical protein